MSDEELDFGEDDFEHIDDSPIKKSTNFHSIENEEDFDLDDATYLPTDLTASGYSGTNNADKRPTPFRKKSRSILRRL